MPLEVGKVDKTRGLGQWKKESGKHKPNARHAPATRREKRLEMRVVDWKRGPQAGYATRVKSIYVEGYHAPGSNKK